MRNGTTSSRPPTPALRPSDVIGAPVLPPAAATRAVTRVRALLARARDAAAPPPVRIMESALAGLELAVLAALCRLDLPDRITGAVPVQELALQLGVDEERLLRLVRFAQVRGWLRLDRRGRVHPTRVTRFLHREHPGGWRAWVMFAAGGEITAALGALDRALQPHDDAFQCANGQPFFTWMGGNPERHEVFDQAMAAGARLHGLVLARVLDWSYSRRVCDIGGGDGTLLEVLLSHQPHLLGVVLELPEVAMRMPPRPRMTARAGDAFRAVPTGCDTYLLVNVLHDWDDRAATLLLSRAAEAARATEADGPPARVIVVESEARRRPVDDLSLLADTLMLALTPGGGERTTGRFRELAAAAELELTQRHRLASGDVALVLTSAVGQHP